MVFVFSMLHIRIFELGALGGGSRFNFGFDDRQEAGAVGEVSREFPEHGATEVLGIDVIAFEADGFAIFVGDEESALEGWRVDPWGFRGGVPVFAVGGGLSGEALLDIPVIEHAGGVPCAGGSSGGGLGKAVVDIWNAFPAEAVEGEADDEFVARHACGEVGVHRGADGERVAGGAFEGGVVVGAVLPRAVEVVGHDIDPIKNGSDGGGLDVYNFVGAGGRGDSEVVAAGIGLCGEVELTAQLGEQAGEVLFVLGTGDIGWQAAATWILPVDIHAIEAVFANEGHSRGCEFRPRGGRKREVGEAAGERPAADGDEGDEMGILGFEFFQLVEIPAQRLVPCVAGIGFFHGCVGIIQNDFPSRRDIGEGVVDDIQILRGDFVNMVIASVNAPLGEIDHDDLAQIWLA